MKQRRIAIIAFLLCACVGLGVGYAALNDTLEIKATSEATFATINQEFDSKIYFSNAELGADANSAKDSATINETDKDIANFNFASFSYKGQTISATFTIKNDSVYNAKVTPKLVVNSSSHPNTETYFSITSDWTKDPEGNLLADTISAGNEKTIEVTVTLKDIPSDASIATVLGSWSIQFDAVTVD